MEREHAEWCEHPKIVALLGRAEAADARVELETCERLGVPPSQFRGRPLVTSYVYDKPGEQGRVVRTVSASSWTAEDRALMLAWRIYQDSLCPGCGHPKATAWHSDNDGWFTAFEPITCWGCTAAREPGEDGTRTPFTYPVVVDTRDYETDPLPLPTMPGPREQRSTDPVDGEDPPDDE